MLIPFTDTSNSLRYVDSEHIISLDWYDDKKGRITMIEFSNDGNIDTYEPIDDVAAKINAVKLEVLKYQRKDV
jgi:hypothetical protein